MTDARSPAPLTRAEIAQAFLNAAGDATLPIVVTVAPEWLRIAASALSEIQPPVPSPTWFLQTVAGEAFTREELRAEAQAMLKKAAPQVRTGEAVLGQQTSAKDGETPSPADAAAPCVEKQPTREALFHARNAVARYSEDDVCPENVMARELLRLKKAAPQERIEIETPASRELPADAAAVAPSTPASADKYSGSKPSAAQRMYDALSKIAHGYAPVERLQRSAQKVYGLDADEVVAMAYENIQGVAAAAIRGMRRPKQ